jgi:G3E family GTPase
MATGEWQSAFAEAEALNKQLKYFDAVQKINASMELFETSLGGDNTEILKDTKAFLEKMMPSMSEEQMLALKKMFVLRGDILVGLGATKRAALEYTNATVVDPADEESKTKKAKLEDSSLTKDGTNKVPCTILTGFLGSGKTTLLNHILQAHHGKRIAVIENEFGEVGIDDGLVQGGAMAEEENIVEMNNGCICCTVRGDLIAGLKKLVKNSKKSNKPLDAVMIETTGLADPAPVAQTFFADDFVQQNLCLDGILTLVDAKHVVEHLEEEKPEGVENEAVEQIAFADRILLNKCDLVDEATLLDVEKRIKAINEPVQIRRTTNSVVDMSFILGIQAFSLDKILEKEDEFLADDHDHQHDDRVSSVGVDVAGEVDNEKLNQWIGWLLKEKGVDLFRSKGILAVKGMSERFVFQAIHMLFANSTGNPWKPGEEKRCKMIFIGKNLNRDELTSGFMACMAK